MVLIDALDVSLLSFEECDVENGQVELQEGHYR